MKRNNFIFILGIFSVAVIFVLSSCKKDEPETLFSNQPRPTWTVPSDYDYSSSMTAVVKIASLNGQMVNDSILNDEDLLAAFAGETCLGIASPQDGLFFLYITWPNNQVVNEQIVNLKYWSAHYKNLFEAKDAINFVNDAHLGTVANPFVPQFVVAQSSSSL